MRNWILFPAELLVLHSSAVFEKDLIVFPCALLFYDVRLARAQISARKEDYFSVFGASFFELHFEN